MKKARVSQISKLKPENSSPMEGWHNGADAEIHLYARALCNAAKALVEKFEQTQEGAGSGWDVCPIILLYKQAMELHLKLLVGEGGNFLKTKIDPITLYKTHSLRWLAQIVCQIIRTVEWEFSFVCEGVNSLAEFNAVIDELESLDPLVRPMQPHGSDESSASQFYRSFNIIEFSARMDNLLALLDSTADALAATWAEHQDMVEAERKLRKPSIH